MEKFTFSNSREADYFVRHFMRLFPASILNLKDTVVTLTLDSYTCTKFEFIRLAETFHVGYYANVSGV